MADQWTPVATGIVPPNPQAGLNTLSSLLGIQQQRQALQTGQYTQASAQAESQVAGQNAKEKMALAQLLQDPVGNGIVDSDGNPTKQAQSIVMRTAPTTGAGHYADIVSAAGKKIEFNNAVNNLRTNERTEVQNTLGGVAADPNATASDAATALGNLVESKRGTPVYDDYKTIGDTASTVLNHADQEQKKLGKQIPPGTEAWRPLALNLVRGGLGAAGIAGAGGIAAGTPTSQDLGGTIQPGVTAPALGGGGFTPQGPPIPKNIPPGFELTEDPLTHNKYLWNRQTGQTKPFGTGAPIGGGGGTPSPAAPPLAPPQRQIGEAEAQSAQVNTNFQNHQANVNASRTANQQLDQIHNVINLLDSGVKTGSGAQALAQSEQALSQIIPGLGSADSQAAKLDLLNKFLERIGSDYGSLNGSPAKTDAGAESLRQQIGSTGYNPNALRSVMKYTAAQYSAAQAKDAGEQQFFAQKGNGILNQDQYEKQWRNSYDPRVFQLANEPKEVSKAALQSMSPADRATFLKKYAELKTMGAAPQ